MSRHPELLIPASSLEVLKTAVIFGADAVYIGGEVFGPVSYTHLDVYKRQDQYLYGYQYG